MVYLLADWGMGESHLHNQHNLNQQLRTADLLSQLSSDRCKDQQDDDEVSLLPLNNQVSHGHGLYVSLLDLAREIDLSRKI